MQFLTKAIADSISMKQLIHFAQIVESDRFQQFDYGKSNKKHYGTSKPPEYDLAATTVPVTIFYGNKDGLVPASVRLSLQP